MIGLHEDVLEMFAHLGGCVDVDDLGSLRSGEAVHFSDPHKAADEWIAATDSERVGLRAKADEFHRRTILRNRLIRFSGKATRVDYLRDWRGRPDVAEKIRLARETMRANAAWREKDLERKRLARLAKKGKAA